MVSVHVQNRLRDGTISLESGRERGNLIQTRSLFQLGQVGVAIVDVITILSGGPCNANLGLSAPEVKGSMDERTVAAKSY